MFSSYRVIELVRKAISSDFVKASDTEVAKAMGISRASVSAYKTGREVMSHETLMRANALMKLSEVEMVAIGFDILIESARSDNERTLYKSMRDAARDVRNWAKAHTASILLVGLALFTAHGKASANVLDVVLSWDLSNHPSIHYAQFRAYLTRLLRKLMRCLHLGLKSHCAAPLPGPWAGIRWKRSPASAPRSWRTSPVCT